MKQKLIMMAMQMLMQMLSPELLKSFADKALDFVEEFVLGTASEVDDKLVLPILEMIRSAFDIED